MNLKNADLNKIRLQLRLLELNGSVEFFNSVLKALLIQEDLATKERVRARRDLRDSLTY